LAVAAHEHLPAQADEGLVAAAMPVVREPRPVQPDSRWVCDGGQKMWLAKKPSP
jgi:hypothetical protein